MLKEFINIPRIAYFSMEIALRNEIPTYSGGLGVLAGDTIRSCADLGIPIVGVTLVSRAGYFHQQIDADGRQVEQPDAWNPAEWCKALDARVSVPIAGRQVWVGAWLYIHMVAAPGEPQPVVLLDTDFADNHPDDRQLTHYLYGGDQSYRLKQEMVLGIGGVKILRALGFNLAQFHMNEGHSALLGLELVKEKGAPYDFEAVRKQCNFTTHTPVEAGHDKFPYELADAILGGFFDVQTLKHLGGEDKLNMTRLAFNLSEFINGVTKNHAELSRNMFPGYTIHAITNGVHPYTWTSKPFTDLYNQHLSGWCHEPELLRQVDVIIADEDIWQAHQAAKQQLIEMVRELSGTQLDPRYIILGFARRMTAYKRPDLLFSDPQRLRDIASRYPLQIVIAGKAHPRDTDGKNLIQQLHQVIAELRDAISIVFLPDYDMQIAGTMVSGSDVWLNTPLRPLEASGTSGMKAALNGVPHLSILDGWWLEGCIEGVTGWAIGEKGDTSHHNDARSLYDKLEGDVMPLYYNDRSGWIRVMKGAIARNASFFNTHRMIRRYITETYIRS